MDRYGHLFPSDLEALGGRMEETYQASRVDAVWTRCGRGVVAFQASRRNPKPAKALPRCPR
jgi:hypothetical protein